MLISEERLRVFYVRKCAPHRALMRHTRPTRKGNWPWTSTERHQVRGLRHAPTKTERRLLPRGMWNHAPLCCVGGNWDAVPRWRPISVSWQPAAQGPGQQQLAPGTALPQLALGIMGKYPVMSSGAFICRQWALEPIWRCRPIL